MSHSAVTTASHRDYLDEQLRDQPLPRALPHAEAARLFEAAGPLPEPLLDLGCGDGNFATLAFNKPLLAGTDPDWRAVQAARARGTYYLPTVARATELPYPSAFFGSVIANDSIAQVPDVEGLLDEVVRVLRPGGRFLFSVPSEHFANMLLGRTLLRQAGLGEWGYHYADLFTTLARHFHTDPPDSWFERLERHSFTVEYHRYYISERAQQFHDLLHYANLPRLLSRQLTGQWAAFYNPISQALFSALLRPFYGEPEPPRGAYLFFQARKQ